MDLHVKLLDSMTKVMPEAKLPVSRELLRGSALRGEVYSFQLAYRCSAGRLPDVRFELEGPLAPYTHTRVVGLIPAEMLNNDYFDENVIGERPGLATAESMSAYIAYNAYVGMPESKRTVVSNIHKDGTAAVEAGAYVADVIEMILDQKASGVELVK